MAEKGQSSLAVRLLRDKGIILSLVLVALGIAGTFFFNRYFGGRPGFVSILVLLFFGMLALQGAGMFSQRFTQLYQEHKKP